MKAVVIGSGNSCSKELLVKRCGEADLIVAADGGARHLYDCGLTPHVLVGDFDSIPRDVLDYYEQQGQTEVLPYPPAKDYTDLELALMIAQEKGASEIGLLGAIGSRFDHTAANVFLLYPLLKKGIRAWMEDAQNLIFLTDHPISIKKQEDWKVSLLSISPEVSEVTTSGLAFKLDHETLFFGSSRGVSNEFSEDTAVIDFQSGLLLVMLSCGD